MQPGRLADPAELESFCETPAPRGRNADETRTLPAVPRPVKLPVDRVKLPAGRGWPDYAQVLAGAPLKPDGNPDRSKADFIWAKWALERGHSRREVEFRLLELSERARGKWGEKYVQRTVEAAFVGLDL